MRYLYLPENQIFLVFQKLLELLGLFNLDLLPMPLHGYHNIDPRAIGGTSAYPFDMSHVNRQLLLWHPVLSVSVIFKVCYQVWVLIVDKLSVLVGERECLHRVGVRKVFDQGLSLFLVNGYIDEGEETQGFWLKPVGQQLRHLEGAWL